MDATTITFITKSYLGSIDDNVKQYTNVTNETISIFYRKQ